MRRHCRHRAPGLNRRNRFFSFKGNLVCMYMRVYYSTRYSIGTRGETEYRKNVLSRKKEKKMRLQQLRTDTNI